MITRIFAPSLLTLSSTHCRFSRKPFRRQAHMMINSSSSFQLERMQRVLTGNLLSRISKMRANFLSLSTMRQTELMGMSPWRCRPGWQMTLKELLRPQSGCTKWSTAQMSTSRSLLLQNVFLLSGKSSLMASVSTSQ